MKKLSLLIFLISILVVPLTTLYGAERPKVAVWDLTSGDIKAVYAQDLTFILVSEIVKLKKYEVYSQENVRTLAGWTAERIKLGCTDTQCLVALGQMDIAKLISGSVGKIGDRYSVSLNLFDTQKARAENAISEFCRSENELIGLVQQAVRKLLGGPMAVISERTRSILDKLRSGRSPFLIDDFESKDLWSISFSDKWKSLSEGKARINISADVTQGANGTSCSMKIDYGLLDKNSAIIVNIGGTPSVRLSEVEKDRSAAYDFSRFRKIVFYLKGKKSETFFSKPNNILVHIFCYGEDIKSRYGKVGGYYNKKIIRPRKEWKKIEIPFDDFVPSAWTKYNIANYPQKPDLHNVVNLSFLSSSWEADGGAPGSNTVWIDEITLE